MPQLCRYITRPDLANERVQTNAAGQVVLQLKTRGATLRGAAGLRTLPKQNDRPEADDRNAGACGTGGPPR
jgi:hypothetical protein